MSAWQLLIVHTTPQRGRIRHNYAEAVTQIDTGSTGTAPLPLRIAAGVVALEASALLVLAVLELAVINTARLTMGLTTALFFAAAGVALGVCGWALWRGRRWGRGPVLTAQLVQLGLAWNLRGGETTMVSLVLVAASAVVVVGVLHRASMSRLNEDPEGN